MGKFFQVMVNGQRELTVSASEDGSEGTLLDAMEANGLEVHYHCRNGFCGACRTKLKAGTVTYINEPLAFVRPGDILPCCCVPTSDLEIDH